jgi:hypothetical protein
MVCSESVTGAPANAAKYPQVRTVAFMSTRVKGTELSGRAAHALVEDFKSTAG